MSAWLEVAPRVLVVGDDAPEMSGLRVRCVPALPSPDDAAALDGVDAVVLLDADLESVARAARLARPVLARVHARDVAAAEALGAMAWSGGDDARRVHEALERASLRRLLDEHRQRALRRDAPAASGGRQRLVRLPVQDHVAALAHHVRDAQADGPVVLVTLDRPHGDLVPKLAAADVDLGRLLVVDAVSGRDIGGPRFMNSVFYVSSPVELERIALRTELACRRAGPGARVLLDSVNMVALYNSEAATQEFVHYLANLLRRLGHDGDHAVLENREGDALAQCVAAFLDP